MTTQKAARKIQLEKGWETLAYILDSTAFNVIFPINLSTMVITCSASVHAPPTALWFGSYVPGVQDLLSSRSKIGCSTIIKWRVAQVQIAKKLFVSLGF